MALVRPSKKYLLSTALFLAALTSLAWASLSLAGTGPWLVTRVLQRSPAARPVPTLLLEPALLLEPPEVDLGRLEPGIPARVEVRWRRVGPGAVRVHGLDADCGCAVPEGLPKILAEGASGTLRVRILPPDRLGPFTSRVRIVAGPKPRRLRILGYVGREVTVAPDRLDLGPRTAGRALERTLEVRTTRRVARGPKPRVSFEGVAGCAVVRAPRRAGALGWSVDVTLEVPRTAGPIQGAVVVRMDERPALQIPVAGRTVVFQGASVSR